MKLRIIENYDDCQGLCHVWNDMINTHSKEILQLDITSTFEWSMVLWETFLDKKDQKIVLFERKDNILGILPLFVSNKAVHHVKCRKIAPITELHAGRCGFIFSELRYDDF